MSFLPNQIVFCRFTAQPFVVVFCDGVIASLRWAGDASGETSTRIVGDLTASAPVDSFRRHDESPSEFAERVERAEAAASEWFNDLAAAQIAEFNGRMDVARAYKGAPKWDRVRDAAKREFARTTADASRIAGMVMADMMTVGEISEATSYAYDEAKVSQTMAQAEPAALPPLNHAVFATAADVAFHYHGKRAQAAE